MKNGIFLVSLGAAVCLFASTGVQAQTGLPGSSAATGAVSGQTGTINEPSGGVRPMPSSGMLGGAAPGQSNGASGTNLNGVPASAGFAAGQTDKGPSDQAPAPVGINAGKAKTYNSYAPSTVQGNPFSTGGAGSFSGSEPSTQGSAGGLAH